MRETPSGVFMIILLILLYFVPTIFAVLVRSHHNGGAILILNLFLGWTILGWIVALIWASTSKAKSHAAA